MLNNKKWLMWLGAIVILILIAGAVCYKVKKHLYIKSEYQAVFLTNGQVYFGKLSMDGRWLKLKDIYYLQVTQALQATGTDQPTQANPNQQVQLVKLGSELHGPQDEMFIEKDKVLFWENLKDDSKVLQKIQESK